MHSNSRYQNVPRRSGKRFFGSGFGVLHGHDLLALGPQLNPTEKPSSQTESDLFAKTVLLRRTPTKTVHDVGIVKKRGKISGICHGQFGSSPNGSFVRQDGTKSITMPVRDLYTNAHSGLQQPLCGNAVRSFVRERSADKQKGTAKGGGGTSSRSLLPRTVFAAETLTGSVKCNWTDLKSMVLHLMGLPTFHGAGGRFNVAITDARSSIHSSRTAGSHQNQREGPDAIEA